MTTSVQSSSRQDPYAVAARAQRDQLGVTGGIGVALAGVVAGAEHRAVGSAGTEHHRTDRHVAGRARASRATASATPIGAAQAQAEAPFERARRTARRTPAGGPRCRAPRRGRGRRRRTAPRGPSRTCRGRPRCRASPAGCSSSSSSGSGRSSRSIRQAANGQSAAAVTSDSRARTSRPCTRTRGRSPRRSTPVRASRCRWATAAAQSPARRARRSPRGAAMAAPARPPPRGRPRRRSRRCPRTFCDGRTDARRRIGPYLAIARRASTSVPRMQIHVADHPLVAHKLTVLRDERPTHRRSAGWPTSW